MCQRLSLEFLCKKRLKLNNGTIVEIETFASEYQRIWPTAFQKSHTQYLPLATNLFVRTVWGS